MTYRAPIAPLFVPADRPERFGKAAASGADAIIIDLEDAVTSGKKDFAREALPSAVGLGVPVFIRINPKGSAWYEADVAALRQLPFENIIVPMAESPNTLQCLRDEIGLRNMVPLIETGKGLWRAVDIANVPGVRQLAFGPADYALDLGIQPNVQAFSFALGLLAVASRACDLLPPLDGPSFDLEGGETLAMDGQRARALGCGGKLCVHPRQVAAVMKAFQPSADELSWAREVVGAAAGEGSQAVGGKMIDRPILERARRLLANVTTESA